MKATDLRIGQKVMAESTSGTLYGVIIEVSEDGYMVDWENMPEGSVVSGPMRTK